MPLSVLVCICFSFCSVNEHWFEFNLANFRKLLNKLVKKALLHIRSCFFKRSCCRGMIRCRFVLQQLHKPDVGFARFFYSSARENSLHVCIYNNRKHDLRINLSPPPAIIGMQFSVIWFFRNLGHFKYRIVLVNHCCNIYRHDCLIFARFHCIIFEQFNYTRKQQTGQPFLSCPVLFWGLMQQPAV